MKRYLDPITTLITPAVVWDNTEETFDQIKDIYDPNEVILERFGNDLAVRVEGQTTIYVRPDEVVMLHIGEPTVMTRRRLETAYVELKRPAVVREGSNASHLTGSKPIILLKLVNRGWTLYLRPTDNKLFLELRTLHDANIALDWFEKSYWL
jgi:hypothetical protein